MAATTVKLGGRNVSEYLMQLLNDDAVHNHQKKLGRSSVESIKKDMCYAAMDPAQEVQHQQNMTSSYCLPDGTSIVVRSQLCFHAPEVLFRPTTTTSTSSQGVMFYYSHEGHDMMGLPQVVINTIEGCGGNETVHKEDLYTNLVLSGGNTMLKGFGGRLAKEVQGLLCNNVSSGIMQVNTSPASQYGAWVGGSILAEGFIKNATTPTTNNDGCTRVSCWISRAVYDEFGAECLIHRRRHKKAMLS